MFFESLEDRRLLNANGLFKHQAVHLKPGHVYTISKSITLRNNQRIIGSSATNPPIIRFDKNTEAGIFIMPENSYNIRICPESVYLDMIRAFLFNIDNTRLDSIHIDKKIHSIIEKIN